jgi:hypothetical protein
MHSSFNEVKCVILNGILSHRISLECDAIVSM